MFFKLAWSISAEGMSSQQCKEIGRLTVQDIIVQTAQRNLKSPVGSSHASSTGINETLHPFFVLEANMVSLKKTIFLSALTSLTVSVEAQKFSRY